MGEGVLDGVFDTGGDGGGTDEQFIKAEILQFTIKTPVATCDCAGGLARF